MTPLINSSLPPAAEESRRGAPLWLLTAVTLVLVGSWLGWDARQDYQTMIEREYKLLDTGAHNRAAHITGLVRNIEIMLYNIERDLLDTPPDRAATRRYAEGFGWAETSAGQLALFRRITGR